MNTAGGRSKKDAASRLRTVRDVLRYAVSQFGAKGLWFGHGSDNAWDEAVYLVLHTLHLPLRNLDPFLDARLTQEELGQVLDVVRQRAAGTPAAYLTKEAWLGEYRFLIDERVIVPRSLIAEPLSEALSPWIADPYAVKRVLDLCTGSGCLAIIAADVFPNALVDAVDISESALAVARMNVDYYQMAERVKISHSDLFQALGRNRYDLILCNPPYVNAASMQKLPAEYRHEPALALAGGQDGLDLVARILEDAPAHLVRRTRQPGMLVLEIGHERVAFDLRYPLFGGTWLSTSTSDDSVVVASFADLTALGSS